MTAPTVTGTTARLYRRLPAVYREADAAEPDWPLLRYLALVVDQVGVTETFLDEVADAAADGVDGVLDLAAAGDARVAVWLPWLAQFVELDLDVTQSAADQAAEIADAQNGRWRHGTRTAIAAAALPAVTDTQTVEVTSHYLDDPWLIGVGTVTTETDIAETWAELEAFAVDPLIDAPTWAGLTPAVTWADLRFLPLLRLMLPQLPAGCRIVRYPITP